MSAPSLIRTASLAAATSTNHLHWGLLSDDVLDLVFGSLVTRDRLNKIERVCKGWSQSSKRGAGWQVLLEMNWDTKITPSMGSIADRIKGHRIKSIIITIEPSRNADLMWLLSKCSNLLENLTLHRIGSGMMFEVLTVLTSAKAPFYKLTHLSLRPTAVYDIEMILPRMPLIQHLDIGFHASQYASEHVNAIFYFNEMDELTELKCAQRNISLRIAGATHTPPKVTWNSPKLASLNVMSDVISSSVFRTMITSAGAALRQVHALWIDPRQMEFMTTKCPQLTSFVVDQWYASSLEQIRNFPNLVHLGIGNDMSNTGWNMWDQLAYLTKLVTLDIVMPVDNASRVALLEVLEVLNGKYALRRINDTPYASYIAQVRATATVAAADVTVAGE